jgi:hypothetical protein
MASPVESGSMAPAIQIGVAQIPDMSQQFSPLMLFLVLEEKSSSQPKWQTRRFSVSFLTSSDSLGSPALSYNHRSFVFFLKASIFPCISLSDAL